MKYRQYYKDLIKIDASTGVKKSENKNVSDEPNLIIEMFDRQTILNAYFRNWDLEKGIRWIQGYANFINHQTGNSKLQHLIKKDFPKGTIIIVDFFGNFGNELTYDHPAIVIAESGKDLIVAPITSTPSLFGDKYYYHIDLPKSVSAYGDLYKDSVIKLEQLRYISKKRILKKMKRVSDNTKLKEIDIALMRLVASKTYEQLELDMKNLIDNIEKEREEKIQLLAENNDLKEKIMELEQQLSNEIKEKILQK